MSFLNDYKKQFNQALEGVDLTFVPKKYLNPERNYTRFVRSLLHVKKMGLTSGLDFGCGCVGTSIMAKLHGIRLVGLDIPYGVDDSKEGERNRGGIAASDVANKESIHLGIQKNLQSMGYDIVLRDTNKYPWNEFEDNKFQFILAYYALSKEWVNHKDILDFSGDAYSKRIQELVRISTKHSLWIIHPVEHLQATQFHKSIAKKKIKLSNWI
jgi:hypothetical protein